MTRPDISKVSKEVKEYIEYLEGRDREREIDGRLALLLSLNKKMLAIASAIDTADIKLDGDDKVTERIVKIGVEVKDITDNLEYLREKLGITNIKDIVTKVKNPIEARASQK